MFPVLQLGPFTLPTPAIIVLVGIWLSAYLAEKQAPRFGVNPGAISNLILLIAAAGLVGARLTYLARYPQAFRSNPADIFSRSPGLLDPAGGVAAAILVGTTYGYRKGLQLWATLDALTTPMALMNFCLAFSNLASGNAYGKPTDVPWGMELWGATRHPSQIYEMVAAACVLALILPHHKWWRQLNPGAIFWSFLALSSSARLFLESFRGDSLIIFHSIRAAQIVSWLILAFSLWQLNRSLGVRNMAEGRPTPDVLNR